jgi:hypothetical protein
MWWYCLDTAHIIEKVLDNDYLTGAVIDVECGEKE